jgi:hypothetical protein
MKSTVDKELMDNLKYGYEVLQDHYGKEIPGFFGEPLVDLVEAVNELVDEIDESFVDDNV